MLQATPAPLPMGYRLFYEFLLVDMMMKIFSSNGNVYFIIFTFHESARTVDA